MKLLKTYLLFYQRLALPIGTLSLLMAAANISEFKKILAISIIAFGILFQYFIYEVRHPNEYFFYFNLGLSRLTLWLLTTILHLLLSVIIVSL